MSDYPHSPVGWQEILLLVSVSVLIVGGLNWLAVAGIGYFTKYRDGVRDGISLVVGDSPKLQRIVYTIVGAAAIAAIIALICMYAK
jgi:uncharacterized membrane protein YuzA (DUF378 family)